MESNVDVMPAWEDVSQDCGPRVQEILANELGVSQLDIVLDKNGSYILCGRTKENGDE
jgi:glycerol-3-phosphate dehydrogenase